MAFRTLLAAGLLAIASAQAQTIDAGIWFDPVAFEVDPIVAGQDTWLRWNTSEIAARSELCTPGVVCVADYRSITGIQPRISQHRELGGSWSETVFAIPGGGHLQTHLAPPTESARGSFANNRVSSFAWLELAPYSTLRIDFRVRMSLEPDLAPSLPYTATGRLDLDLTSWLGTVGNARFAVASSDFEPAHLDETGFLAVTNEYGGPMTLWLRTTAAIDSGITPVPEPHAWWLLASGLAVVGFARRWRKGAASFALSMLAVAPLAQAQHLDAELQLGPTSISLNGAPAEFVDWHFVTLNSGICVPATDCRYEEFFRYGSPEVFEHSFGAAAQWAHQAYHGDASGASATLHLEPQASVSTGVSSLVGTRITYRLEPGATISLSMPVSSSLTPSGGGLDYELWAHFVLDGVVGNFNDYESDRAEAISTAGNAASVDDTLSITLTNTNPWGELATVIAWGHLEAHVTVVPEPAPVAMMTAGLLLLPVARAIARRAARVNGPAGSP